MGLCKEKGRDFCLVFVQYLMEHEAALHKNSGTQLLWHFPPQAKEASKPKGTTLKEVTQLALLPFHIQIFPPSQMALVGDRGSITAACEQLWLEQACNF